MDQTQTTATPPRRRGCCGCCLLKIAFIGLCVLAFYRCGLWLDVTRPAPARADLIYVFAGGEWERPQYGARLFRAGHAPRMLTAGELKTDKLLALGIRYSEADVNKKVLTDHGVPASRVDDIDRGSSTWDEVHILYDYMQKHRMKSAILVTSNFHTRRVRKVARKVFRGTGITIVVTSPPHSTTNLDAWWGTERDFLTVFNEYLKLFYYSIKYAFKK